MCSYENITEMNRKLQFLDENKTFHRENKVQSKAYFNFNFTLISNLILIIVEIIELFCRKYKVS